MPRLPAMSAGSGGGPPHDAGVRRTRLAPVAPAARTGPAAPTVLPAACASGPRPGCRGGRPGCRPVACRRPRARPPADRAWRLAQAACGRPALDALGPGPPVGRGQQGLPRRRRAARPQVPRCPGHRHPERQRPLRQPGRKGRLGELRLSDLPRPEGQIRRAPEAGEAHPRRRRHGARLDEPHYGRRVLCRAGAARPGRLAGRKARARRLVGGPVLVAGPPSPPWRPSKPRGLATVEAIDRLAGDAALAGDAPHDDGALPADIGVGSERSETTETRGGAE